MKFEYKGKAVQILPPVRRYVNSIERRLNLPRKIRQQVMSDIVTGICARREDGETDSEIMDSMGTPKQVAAGINEEMAAYAFRKSPWRFAFLGAGAVGLFNLVRHIPFYPEAASIGIIGGADGPTAIYVTSVPNVWTYILWLAVFLAGTAGFFLMRRLRPKK